MKRVIVAVVVAVVLVVGFALTAWAHVPKVTEYCDRLEVSAKFYDARKDNHIRVVIDGQTVVSEDFGSSYEETFPWDGSVEHVWRVYITAWDDPYGKEGWTDKWMGCSDPCVTTTTSTTVPDSTTTTFPEETTTTLTEETTTTVIDTTSTSVDDSTTTTVGDSTTTTEPTPPTTPPELPFTGADTTIWAAVAVALTAVGGFVARKFRDDS